MVKTKQKTRKYKKQHGSAVPEHNNNNINEKEGTITIAALIKKLDKIHKAKGNIPVFMLQGRDIEAINHVDLSDQGGWDKVILE